MADATIRTWSSPSRTVVVLSASHGGGWVGDVNYAWFAPGAMALFAGRPFLWGEGDDADGRSPLDPRLYLQPPARWLDALDGRYGVARFEAETDSVELYTDALGAYPLYEAQADGVIWAGNNPALLAELSGSPTLSEDVLAAFLGAGWSLGGDPVWSGVRRLSRGVVHRLAGGRRTQGPERLPVERIAGLFGAGYSAGEAARTILTTVRALADWPGRPSEVPVTGGRDSRLVLAAVLRSGAPFTAMTKAFGQLEGYPRTSDVKAAQLLCSAVGIAHRVILRGGAADPLADVRRAAELLTLTGPATVSLGDSLELPLEPVDAPLALVHSGQGGELARAFYGLADDETPIGLATRLFRRVSPPFPRRILNAQGAEVVQGWIRGWVGEQVARGVAPADVPDLFYLLVRMGAWGAPGLTSREFAWDTTSPLWTLRLLAQQFGPTRRERRLEAFHREVMQSLKPDLAGLAFAGGKGWPTQGSAARGRVTEARTAADKLVRELRRRGRHHLRHVTPVEDPGGAHATFPSAAAAIKESVYGQPGHAAWHVLDRSVVARLFRRHPASLDPRSREQVLRLGTLFMPEGPGRR